jgi:hypothetical protein
MLHAIGAVARREGRREVAGRHTRGSRREHDVAQEHGSADVGAFVRAERQRVDGDGADDGVFGVLKGSNVA